MLESDIKTNSFDIYHAEYLEFFKQYEKKKQEVEILYARPANPNVRNWNLDFASGELTID